MSIAKPYLIANMRVGLERDMEPWLLPNDAYPDLEDCYLWRGRIVRRKGFTKLGQIVTLSGGISTPNGLPVMGLRNRETSTLNQQDLIAFDTTKANVFNNLTVTFNDITFHGAGNTVPFSWTGSDSQFFWTENYLNGFWATNSKPGFQNATNVTNPAQGDGIRFYDGGVWTNFLPQVDGTNFLMGSLMIFSFRGRLVMLNTTEGTSFSPQVFTNFPQRARWSQNGTPYTNATPAGYTGGTDVNAWRSDIAGKGGFIDAPTSEQIISAQFFRDNLVVFFERSTWQLRYTGNELLPFIWERINVELGVESTFSMVPFDGGIIGVGNYGIMSCDSTGVHRIDQIIPDEVFKIHNGNDGTKRVYGIRDYTQQLVYWTFPDETNNPTYPNRVLVYNYLDGSYAFFNDSFTCFGTFQNSNNTTWSKLTQTWDSTPQAWGSGKYQSNYPQIVAGNQQGFVVANYNAQEIENDFILNITGVTNANPAVITSTNHNLTEGQIITIKGIVGLTLSVINENTGTANIGSTSFNSNTLKTPIQPTTFTLVIGANTFTDDGLGNLILGGIKSGTINYSSGFFTTKYSSLAATTNALASYTKNLNGGVFRVDPTGANTFKIQNLDQNGNFIYVDTTDLSGYSSGGLIEVRNNFLVLSKRFNPFIQEGNQLRLQYVDYFVEADDSTQFTSTIYLDENDNTGIQQDGIIPFSNFSGKTWIRTYYSIIGQFAQIQLSYDNQQMFDQTIPNGDITIHAMMLWMGRGGRLTYGTTF